MRWLSCAKSSGSRKEAGVAAGVVAAPAAEEVARRSMPFHLKSARTTTSGSPRSTPSFRWRREPT